VALVEGNYLLLRQGRWRRVGELLDLSLCLVQPYRVVRRSIIERHIAGGRSRAGARDHFRRVDHRNFLLCMRAARHADLLVRRDARHRVTALRAPV
jgi:pantothenate kinase